RALRRPARALRGRPGELEARGTRARRAQAVRDPRRTTSRGRPPPPAGSHRIVLRVRLAAPPTRSLPGPCVADTRVATGVSVRRIVVRGVCSATIGRRGVL